MKIIIFTLLLMTALPVYGEAGRGLVPVYVGGTFEATTATERAPVEFKEPKRIQVATTTVEVPNAQIIELRALIEELRALITLLQAQQK